MAGERVMLVEDEAGIRELIRLYMEKREYVVIEANNGEKALELANTKHPEIILLDIEMPGINGFEVCQRIREVINIPIIFLSGRRDVTDKIKCFELGGDDYITKPFDFAELEARVRANLRRYQQNNQVAAHVLKYGELEINLDSYECFINHEACVLSTKEMKILILLAQHPNQVWSAEQIYDHIWGFEATGDIQAVKVHISKLRRKLEKDPANPQYIQTVRGFGYHFKVNKRL